MKLVFAGDPMCSWCYGFAKELKALVARHPELALSILVGGVRAGATDVLDEAGKQFRLAHWARVGESSGLPFNRKALLGRENFVYDTEPVCRAVVTARRLTPDADQLPVFDALQRGFYVDGLDTTDASVLSAIGAAALREQGKPVSDEHFLREWKSHAAIAETANDFSYVRALGISSFPHLLLQDGQHLISISPGYAGVDQVDRALNEALRQRAAA